VSLVIELIALSTKRKEDIAAEPNPTAPSGSLRQQEGVVEHKRFVLQKPQDHIHDSPTA
jgi:hypothetical protein